MKTSLAFDPTQTDYGPASAAVRKILALWSSVDWFAPPSSPSATLDAMDRFHEHHALAHAAAPDLVPQNLSVHAQMGSAAEFVALCTRVQSATHWDWKHSGLKMLAHNHKKALGWTLEEYARTWVHAVTEKPAPSLLLKLQTTVIWSGLDAGTQLEGRLPEGAMRRSGRWYASYVDIDFTSCIEWQLAEGSADLTGNPFWPLVQCYAAGAYPFSLAPRTMVLFVFTR